MTERVGLWPLRVLWASLPITAGAVLAESLGSVEPPFGRPVTVALWLGWSAVLLALLVPSPVTLTGVRLVVPAAPVAVLWAAAGHDVDALGLVGIASVLVAACLVLLPATADTFVDGASYGNERRFVLRVPVALLLGPIPGAWLVTVVGACAGPLLCADGRWAIGVPVTALGWVAAALAVRALHGLSQRWLVFVPNGLVVHDPFTFESTLPIDRRSLQHLGPGSAPSALRAAGEPAPTFGVRLAVEVDPPVRASVRVAKSAQWTELSQVLVAPSRPGRALAEARARRLPVG